MSYTIDFDAGTDGTAIATGGAITAKTGTPTYSASNAVHGAMAGLFSSGTATTCIRSDTSPSTHSGSVYLKLPVTPDASFRFMTFGDTANTTTVCNIHVTTGRVLQLSNASTSVQVTGTHAIPVGQNVRLDWQFDNSNTSAPILTVRLFLSAESTTWDEELTFTFTGTTNTFQRINYGIIGSAAVTNRQIVMDTIRVSDGLSWAAPFNPPVGTGENVIYGPADYYHSGNKTVLQAKARSPKDLAANDALLAVLAISSTQGVAPTLPSGWSLLVPVRNLTNCTIVFAYRINAPADTEFTFSWGAVGKASLLILPIGGEDSAAAFDVPTVVDETTSQTGHTAPAFTSTVDGRRLNILVLNDGVQSITPPAGDTLRGQVYGLRSGSNAIAVSDSGANVTAGSLPTESWTSDQPTDVGSMLSVVIKPSTTAIGTRLFQGNTRFMVAQASTTSFKVNAKTLGATSVRLAYSLNSDMSSPSFIAAQAPDSRGYVRFAVPSLAANTTYYYQLMDTPAGLTERAISDIGNLKTLKAAGVQSSFNFAFGADQDGYSTVSAALDNCRTWAPDFFVHLGDLHNFYPDQVDTVMDERFYEAQIQNAAGLKTFLRSMNTFYVRSDRDGSVIDRGDSNTAPNQNSLESMKNIFPMTLADTRNPTIGSYTSWVHGRVRFILLDTRNSDRSAGAATQTASKTMLGATQKAWLKSELLQQEPVKVIFSDPGWIKAASTTEKDQWWSYDNERQEIGNFIAVNDINVLMCVGSDQKLHASSGSFNPNGGFPVVGAAPLDNIGSDICDDELEYSTGASRGSQYGRVEVTDTGDSISMVYRGWDAFTDGQVVHISQTFDTKTPAIWTGTGNENTATVVGGQDIVLTKPDNVGPGDGMLVQAFHRTAYGPGFDLLPGWQLVSLVNTPYTMGIYYRKADISDTAGTTYTWHTNGAAGRGVGRIVRVTGMHPTAPFDTVGAQAGTAGTTSVVLPGVDPETTNALLVAVMGAGRSSTTPAVFDAPSGMGQLSNQFVSDGASTSSIGMATQILGTGGATGDKTSNITPAAANSVGLMFAIRSMSQPVAASLSRVALHAMTSSSFKVHYRTQNASSVRLVVSAAADMSSPVFSSASTPDVDGYGSTQITGLTPDTNYWYRIEMNGVIKTDLTVPVRTTEINPSAFSFLAASCAVTGSNDTVFDAMRTRVGADTKKARFFSHLGDWDYTWGNGGVTPDDMAQIINARELAFAQSNQAALFREISLDYGWSDVDFGGSNSDGTSVAGATMQAAFRKIWDTYNLPSTVGGIQRSWVIGRIRFVRTDVRSMSTAKGAADDASKTMLGTEQKDWFKNELLTAKANNQLVIWFSDNLWVHATETPDGNRDAWSVYNTERTELADFITTNGINVYMIHGDTHSLLADDGTNNPFGGFAWTCVAPMHQQAPVYAGTVSNGKYPDDVDGTIAAAHMYGWFDISDDGTNIDVVMKGFTSEGTQRITMTKTYNIPQAAPPVITRWNGTAEEPMAVDGIWNGATIVPAQLSLAP